MRTYHSDECQGRLVSGDECRGVVTLREKATESFGIPFVSHAYLCGLHAEYLGWPWDPAWIDTNSATSERSAS